MNSVTKVPECLVDQAPMQERGYMIGEDTLGKFALEFYSCVSHDLGRIMLIGKLQNGMKSQWTNLAAVEQLATNVPT